MTDKIPLIALFGREMIMNNKLENLWKLHAASWASFERRAGHEFKFALSLWTAAVGLIAILLQDKTLTIHWFPALLASISFILVHTWYEFGMSRSNDTDLFKYYNLENTILSEIGHKWTDKIYQRIDKHKSKTVFNYWSHIGHISITCILAVIIFFLVISRNSNKQLEIVQVSIMNPTFYVEHLSAITAILAALAAIFSGWCAFLSYRLSSKIRDELKSDERIIVSKITHPELENFEHKKSVIKCNIFNKSKRKVYVYSVKAFDQKNNLIDITWSNRIDKFGNPQDPCDLVGIIDTEEIFLRHNIGEAIGYCRLEIFHSFSSCPTCVLFDPISDFIQDEE